MTQLRAAPPLSASATGDRVEAGLHREDHALRRAEVGAGEHDLVDGLDGLAAARRPEVGDRLAHACRTGRARSASSGSPPTKIVRVAFFAPSEPPETGASTKPTPRSRRRRGELAVAGRDRGAVDDEAALAQAIRDAVGAEQDGLDVRRVRDADHHDVRRARRLARAGRDAAAEPGEVVATTLAPVPARDLEARPAQVRGHRRTHRAQPHERDPFHPSPTSLSSGERTGRRGRVPSGPWTGWGSSGGAWAPGCSCSGSWASSSP